MKMYVLNKSVEGLKSVSYLLAVKDEDTAGHRFSREDLKARTLYYLEELSRLFIERYAGRDAWNKWVIARNKGNDAHEILMNKMLDKLNVDEYLTVVNFYCVSYDMKFYKDKSSMEEVETAYRERARKKTWKEIIRVGSKNLYALGMAGAVLGALIALITGFNKENTLLIMTLISFGAFFKVLFKDFNS